MYPYPCYLLLPMLCLVFLIAWIPPSSVFAADSSADGKKKRLLLHLLCIKVLVSFSRISFLRDWKECMRVSFSHSKSLYNLYEQLHHAHPIVSDQKHRSNACISRILIYQLHELLSLFWHLCCIFWLPLTYSNVNWKIKKGV